MLVCALAAAFLCSACHADGSGAALFENVDFNWPPPRELGEAGYFAVARDGKAACSIVIPASPLPQEEKSAEVLKTYLDLVTGASFEIKSEPAAGPAIYIGETEVAKNVDLGLPPIRYASLTLPNLHGFLVQTLDPQALIIRGALEIGTAFGVTSFIREYLGVRRYWPSEPGGIGDCFEKRPTLSIPKLAWRDWPYFIGRHVGFNAKGWELGQKNNPLTMTRWYRLYNPLKMMHNFYQLLPVAEYGKTHPEYFPEVGGKRVIPASRNNWQPCVSNPEVVGICARKIIEAFDADPNLICHALAVNDGGGDCQCANCRAMDPPEADVNTGQLTDRYVKFMNKVAEKVAAKYPNRLIGFLAYASVRFPPTSVKLHPNLIPFYCCMSRGLYQGWEDWMAAAAKNMGAYGYHDDRWFTIPKINPHQEARRMRFLVESNVARGYYKEFNPTYPLDAQSAIICADMMWDPRLDEEKILDGYYTDMFAEASAEMRRFYGILEADYEDWLKRTSPPHRAGPDRSDLDLDHNFEQFQVLSAAGADRAWQALVAAEAKAEDGRVRQRIGLVRSIFSFVRPCAHEYWLAQSLPKATTPAQAEKQAREILRLAREIPVLKRDVMESPAVKPWTMIYREPYSQIAVGVIPQEVYRAIDEGFAAAWRAQPKNRSGWKRLAGDKDQVIARSAQVALAMPGMAKWPNMIGDPGFESGAVPELAQTNFQRGRVAITGEKPHSGKHCVVIYDSKSAGMVNRFACKPGEKYWVSVWLRAKDVQGRNFVHPNHSVAVRALKGTRPLNWLTEGVSLSEKWQEFRIPFTTPAGAEVFELMVGPSRQHAGSKLWIDDLKALRAPVAPLASPAAGEDDSAEGVPEE